MADSRTTLKQVRERFRHKPKPPPAPTPARPPTKVRGKLDIDAMRRDRIDHSEGMEGRFERLKTKDHDDFRIMFGAQRGKLISEIAGSSASRSYLTWMLREDFPQPVKDVIKWWLEHTA